MEPLRRAFAFKPASATILVVLVYTAIFFGVLVTDDVQPIPKDTLGLDLEQGYKDLHQVSLHINLSV